MFTSLFQQNFDSFIVEASFVLAQCHLVKYSMHILHVSVENSYLQHCVPKFCFKHRIAKAVRIIYESYDLCVVASSASDRLNWVNRLRACAEVVNVQVSYIIQLIGKSTHDSNVL